VRILAPLFAFSLLTSSLSGQQLSTSSSADSLNSSNIKARVESLSRSGSSFLNLADSLKPELAHYQRKLDSIQHTLTHRIDSLQKLNLPAQHYRRVLDSIRNAGPINDVREAAARLAALENQVKIRMTSINANLNTVEKKINDEVQVLNKAGVSLGKVNVPGVLQFSKFTGNRDKRR
jgi:chromosome segregation ATPase